MGRRSEERQEKIRNLKGLRTKTSLIRESACFKYSYERRRRHLITQIQVEKEKKKEKKNKLKCKGGREWKVVRGFLSFP